MTTTWPPKILLRFRAIFLVVPTQHFPLSRIVLVELRKSFDTRLGFLVAGKYRASQRS